MPETVQWAKSATKKQPGNKSETRPIMTSGIRQGSTARCRPETAGFIVQAGLVDKPVILYRTRIEERRSPVAKKQY